MYGCMDVCVYVCMYVCMSVCVYMRACVYVCVRVFICVWMDGWMDGWMCVFMCVCIYVCTYVYVCVFRGDMKSEGMCNTWNAKGVRVADAKSTSKWFLDCGDINQKKKRPAKETRCIHTPRLKRQCDLSGNVLG
jgi:hypothetical protein